MLICLQRLLRDAVDLQKIRINYTIIAGDSRFDGHSHHYRYKQIYTVSVIYDEQPATVEGHVVDGEFDEDCYDVEYLSDMTSDEEDNDGIPKEDSKSFLRTWYRDYNISQQALSSMLKFLKRNGSSDLPCDSRALLHTPIKRKTISIPPGNYCHVGLKRAIDVYMQSCEVTPTQLEMDINVDGVPISRSSNSGFWLILAKIFSVNSPPKIFVIGIYHGDKKPKNFSDFLKPFITEEKILPQYRFNNVLIPLQIRCIVCDAPARHYCLGNKGYNGYFGCGRCIQEGDFGTRMTFPEIHSTKRTNKIFREKIQPEHHLLFYMLK